MESDRPTLRCLSSFLAGECNAPVTLDVVSEKTLGASH